jgi:hypothetical protein
MQHHDAPAPRPISVSETQASMALERFVAKQSHPCATDRRLSDGVGASRGGGAGAKCSSEIFTWRGIMRSGCLCGGCAVRDCLCKYISDAIVTF